MAPQSSNLGASSSTRVRKQKRNKRKQDAIHGEQPKKQRNYYSQLTITAAHPNTTAAVLPAMAMTTFPFAGVNGAALHWSTATALAAAGQMVSVQLPLISYEQATMAGGSPSPAPAMEEALENIKSDTLGRLLSAVMRSCDPPMMLQPQSWTGPPPPWWPALEEEEHKHTTTVPFAPPYRLRKEEKVALLVAIIKHHAPDLDVFSGHAMCERAKLSNDPEAANWWKHALAIEAARHNLPVPKVAPVMVNLIMAPPHAAGDQGGGANGDDQGVMVAGGDYVTALADNGDHGLVVAGAEPEQEKEQPGDGVLDGGADIAGDADVERPVDFLGEDFASADMDQLLDDMLAPFQMQLIEEAPQIQAVDAEAEAHGEEVMVEAAKQEEGPWYMEEDMTNFFEEFELLKDENGKNYLDYFDF